MAFLGNSEGREAEVSTAVLEGMEGIEGMEGMGRKGFPYDIITFFQPHRTTCIKEIDFSFCCSPKHLHIPTHHLLLRVLYSPYFTFHFSDSILDSSLCHPRRTTNKSDRSLHSNLMVREKTELVKLTPYIPYSVPPIFLRRYSEHLLPFNVRCH